ncbi:MAG: DUF3592 domain-containing protein [Planctomycetota bacterium]
MKRFLPGGMFFFMGAIFPFVGWSMAEETRSAMKRWIEVSAQVAGHEILFEAEPVQAEAELEEVTGGKASRPGLRLRYLVDGMPAEAEGLYSADLGLPTIWNPEDLAPYPVGRKLTVWTDPQDLTKAYLDRAVPAMPYVIILMPMIFVSFGAMFLLFPPVEGKKQYDPGTPWAWRTFLFIWNSAGIAAAAHYFSQPGSMNAGDIALFSIYLGIGVLPVLVMVNRAVRA